MKSTKRKKNKEDNEAEVIYSPNKKMKKM